MAGEMAERIGERIRARRLELGLNQRELAERMPPAVSGQHISNWERGVNRPTDRNVELLAAALEVDVAYFYSPEQEKPPETPNLMGVFNDDDVSPIDALLSRLDALEDQVRLLRAELAAVDAEALKRNEEVLRAIRESR